MTLIHFPQTIDRYLRRWSPTLRPGTLAHKRTVLNGFRAYLNRPYPHLKSFAQLQRHPHIEGWLDYIGYLKPVSRNLYIRSLQLFFEDLILWQWPEAPPPGLLSRQDLCPDPFYLPRPLPPELDQPLQQTLMATHTLFAMGLLLLRLTGMRVGELCDLSSTALENTGSGSFSLRIPIGKTRRERLIPIDAPTVALIQRIIAQRGCQRHEHDPSPLSDHLMLDPFGHRFVPSTYNANLQRLAAPLNPSQRITCHRLRHTFATEMARAGMPLPALMKLLGHQTPRMTMRYVDVAQIDMRQAYDKAIAQTHAMGLVHTQPLLPSSPHRQSPAPDQILGLIMATLTGLEHRRRDAQDPAIATKLRRLIKRIRKTIHDFNSIL